MTKETLAKRKEVERKFFYKRTEEFKIGYKK